MKQTSIQSSKIKLSQTVLGGRGAAPPSHTSSSGRSPGRHVEVVRRFVVGFSFYLQEVYFDDIFRFPVTFDPISVLCNSLLFILVMTLVESIVESFSLKNTIIFVIA